MNDKKIKTPWDDVSLIWKKIAGVIAAVRSGGLYGHRTTGTITIANT